ncbi:MAG: RNB domain-containing ribonuclease [Acidobacteria bacterium]|nr:RNB domain-containing ribonuclease [Acidobacteriota bacterium]
MDFDLPEPVIELDEQGFVTAIVRSERNIAHRLIEEFMLAANEAVASRLEKLVPASIYRIHEKPDPKRVIEFEQVAATFGYSLGVGPVRARDLGYTVRRRDHTKGRRELIVPESDTPITSRHYQKLIGRHLAALSEADRPHRRKTRGAHPELPDAAVAQAGPLQRRQRRPLRPGIALLHALHLAHPALPGPGGAPAFEGHPGR